MPRVRASSFTALCLLTVPLCSAEPAEELFVRRVWPMFQEKCIACHGQDEAKIKGGLDMRSQEALLKGGDSGSPSLVHGSAEKSPLYLASTRQDEDWEAMPPKEADKLSPQQLAWLKSWIDGGAPWPDEARQREIAKANAEKWSAEDGVVVPNMAGLSAEWSNRRYKPEALWAYQPVTKPTLDDPRLHPVDQLIDKRMPAGVTPAPPADARHFIRRASFDLTGLPPAPEMVEAFERDFAKDADTAVERLVEQLLSSPHYGERMARHWLDVVRYADSSGFANDYERGNAWRYRDYVVRAFNSDKPYDQFVREQIAGDELQPQDPEHLIAVGFLRMGPWELTGMEVAKVARQRFLDDVTNSVGETFLAHSLQCARCHDHKFDPVPTHDYYAMQACFSTTQLAERSAPFLKEENTTGFEELRYLEKMRDDHVATLRELDAVLLKNAEQWYAENGLDRSEWDKAVARAKAIVNSGGQSVTGHRKRFTTVFDTARASFNKMPEDTYPPKLVGFTPQQFGMERVARKGLERLKWEMERYEPYALSVYNGRTPQMTSVYQPLRIPADAMTEGELEETAILGGGDPFSPSTRVKPGVLSVLGTSEIEEKLVGRRTALARWIASAENPLTTRAIVNRIWLWHFGQPIAGNPNNFGSTGKKPSHPELLDWLAATFVEQGWSFKTMHRLIMTSATYRRSATLPENTTGLSREELEQAYAVFKPRRLTGEELRDAMLATSGELNRTLGGIPNRPEINLEAAMQPRMVMGTFASAWVPNPLPSQRHRRSLYALKLRGLRDPFLEVFNEPAPDFSCEQREASTVTPQVFSLFNSQSSYNRALAMAARVMKSHADSPIQQVFRLSFGRRPTAAEAELCTRHWKQMTSEHEKLALTPPKPPQEVLREAVEENTGEKFSFTEKLHAYADFIPDLQPDQTDATTRALADVCLALLNSNEFTYIY